MIIMWITLLMNYYMKVCIYVDDYYVNNFVDELLHEGMYICWWLLYE